MRWRVIDGCPDPASIAPYHFLVLRRAEQMAESIGRGSTRGETRILHAHGKHNQAEIHRMLPAISNPEGFSEHERKSDGPAANKGIPRGDDLPVWMQGVDSGGNDEHSKALITAAAAHYGWKVVHPYSRGVEGHHWRFDEQPRPKGLRQRAQIVKLRATLPRS